eukprot:SAG31_NODE_41026_length_278_cov_0.575419_1_plen_92_part_11
MRMVACCGAAALPLVVVLLCGAAHAAGQDSSQGRGGLLTDHFVDPLRFAIRSAGLWRVQLGSEGEHPVVVKSAANPLLQEDKPWEAAWWNTE